MPELIKTVTKRQKWWAKIKQDPKRLAAYQEKRSAYHREYNRRNRARRSAAERERRRYVKEGAIYR